MSRPITLTNEIIDSLVQDFKENLMKQRVFDGKLDYKVKLDTKKDDKATVVFSNLAFTKMLSLVMCFDDEVAWHGTVERDGDVFYITDVMVYPQEVTGATVNTDQGEYTEWLYEFNDDTFNKLRFQGHSHVNMGVTPSSTDLNHQESILTQLSTDDFYIFLIMNKKMQIFIRVFDLSTNTIYEREDIDIRLGNTEFDIDAFYADAKAMVKKKTYPKKNSKKKDDDYFDYASYYAYKYGYGD